MKYVFLLCLGFLFFVPEKIVLSQIKVAFEAEDGLLVVADHYLVNSDYPYILLFHNLESSRGEFREIAHRLNKLGYNCLAVDLRLGREINFIRNETAQNAASMKLPSRLIDTKRDMIAAIEYVKNRSELPVILFGSTFSASLALVLAKNRADVKAVVAFSPGDYFLGSINVRNQIKGLQKPVFIAATPSELKFVTEITEGISDEYKQIFTNTGAEGVQGAKVLWNREKGSDQYWLALLMFFNKLKNIQVN